MQQLQRISDMTDNVSDAVRALKVIRRRRRLARRKQGGVALRPTIIISGGRSGVGRIFDREIRLFYQSADGRRRLMQL